MRRLDDAIPRTRGWGLTIALATAVVSGFAVYLNGFGVREWGEAGASSATYTTAKNMVAALVLLAVAVVAGAGRRGRPAMPARSGLGLIAVAVVGGSIPFLLFFEGLSRASSSQAALIHKSLVIWVALLAVPLLRERLAPLHLVAIGLVVAGQLALAGGVDGLAWGSGEWLILAATLLWSVEVVVAKRLLAEVPALTLGVARMGLGAVLLIGFVVVTGHIGELSRLGWADWMWVAVAGGTLALYVAGWYLGLARAQAVDVTAVLVLAAVITAALQTGISGAPLPAAPGLVMIATGVALVVVASLRRRTV